MSSVHSINRRPPVSSPDVGIADGGVRSAGQSEAPTVISIRNLRKSFPGGLVAIDSFSLDVHAGEVISLLGPSGCGKTTTLRCLAGLESPDSGEIAVNGRPVYSSERKIAVPPEHRGFSMVFQQYALWPHMNVFDNVAFGLRVKGATKAEVREKTEGALRRVRLWEKHASRVTDLSGGQQQRVALARAISFSPEIILFDEPLSNLDAKLREELRLELLQLQRELGFAAIYVTHDQDEAISLSSRVVIMNAGRCEQVGTPQLIWREPATSFVARFIGSTNRLRGTVRELLPGEEIRVETRAGIELHGRAATELKVGDEVEVFVRIGDVSLGAEAPDTPALNHWPSTVRLISFQGDSTLLEVQFGERSLLVRQSGETRHTEGSAIRACVSPANVRCYRIDGQASDEDNG